MESSAELLQSNPSPLPLGDTLSPNEQELLTRARHIADTVLEIRAELVDTCRASVWENLRALSDAGLVGVTTPVEFGGQGASPEFMRQFTEALTGACGTTWFVLTQHLGACGQFATSENRTLRERFLRRMAAGDHYVGVGFGHLRRPQAMLRATETSDGNGYILNGVAPWVTGWPGLAGVIFGATLPDERHVYLYAPAEERHGMSSTPPLPLCAMNATATTEVHLKEYYISKENWIKFSSRAQMMEGDRRGVAGLVHPALGCAGGSLKDLRRMAAKRDIPVMREAADALEQEIAECRANGVYWANEGDKSAPEFDEQATNARVWAIELGVRAAHMAVAAASGGGNNLDNSAQRRFREAMFYTLTAQTGAILSATLHRLSLRSASVPLMSD